MHVNLLWLHAIPLVVALVAAGFTLRIWRDHRSLTASEVGKGLEANSARRERRVTAALEEHEARYQTLRREFTRLATEVADILEDAQRKVQKATMRDRRAKETSDRNEARSDGNPQMTAQQAWELERQARMTGQWPTGRR